MPTNSSTYRVQRALQPAELGDIFATIAEATSTGDLIHRAVRAVFTPLLAVDGRSFDDVTGEHRLDPRRYAIPTVQWKAIMNAVGDRAAEWGTSAELSLYLCDAMPSHYHDPRVPAPVVARMDRRPDTHHLEVTREATDVIAACDVRV
jgi:hypothetical protein